MTPDLPGPAPDPQNGGRPSPFRPHGTTTVWSDGALVHVLAEGPFNQEAADAFSEQVTTLYRQLPPGLRFVNLTEFRGSMQATPETWEHLEQHLKRVDASSVLLVATAWIAGPEVEGRALFMPKAQSLFTRLGRRFAIFETAAEAKRWARALLAS